MKIQNFLSRSRQNNRLLLLQDNLVLSTTIVTIIVTQVDASRMSLYPLAKTRFVWCVKNNFISNKSLNNGTFSRFKRFLTPYKTRDMKIQNFPSRNRQKNLLSHMTRHLSLLTYIHTIRSRKLVLSSTSK